MRSLSPKITEHINSTVTSLTTCWRIERKDGTIMRFTDHDADIDMPGDNTYKSASGAGATDFATNREMSVNNMDIMGIITNSDIVDEDILAGKYDNAEVIVFLVNWKDLTAGIIPLTRGIIGEITYDQDTYIAELRGLSQYLQQAVGENYSQYCRAQLGDHRCKVDLTPYTTSGRVVSVSNNRIFTATAGVHVEDYFKYGLLTWSTGANVGLNMEITHNTTENPVMIHLFGEMKRDIRIGDRFTAYGGCDKVITTCGNKFNNTDNFRGEPYIPGEKALSYEWLTKD